MATYFQPLRRKLGVLTLLFACGFMGGWMRSLTDLDALFWLKEKVTYSVVSFNGYINWERIWPVRTPRPTRWLYRHNGSPSFEDPMEGTDIHWRYAALGFSFSAFSTTIPVTGAAPLIEEFESWDFPYWSIVVPLTLLSTWLLLSKPRVKVELSASVAGRNL